MGSASELEYQLLLSKDLGYLPDEMYREFNLKVIELKKLRVSLKKISDECDEQTGH